MKDAPPVMVLVEKEEYNPFEVWLLVALLITGVLSLIGVVQSAAIIASVPPIGRLIWNLLLSTGAIAALFGMYWKPHTHGRAARIAGLLWAGTGAFVYYCVMLYFNGANAAMPATIVGSLAFAAWFRAAQIRRQIVRMIKKVEENHVATKRSNSGVVGGDSTDQ